MTERTPHVVDASVVTRWYTNSPPLMQEALRVRDDLTTGKISLFAPENLLHEVTGAMHRAVLTHRLTARQASIELHQFLTLDLTFIETADLVLPAWELSLRYGCSYYDAIYLEVARRFAYPFIHADEKLHNVLNARFPLEIWIGDNRRSY